MSDTAQRPSDASPTLSPATRLVEGALQLVEVCGCDEPTVTLLRGFDARSRSRARAVRDRLLSRDVRGAIVQASVAASPEHLSSDVDEELLNGHSCGFVDLTPAASKEAARLAGWFDAPLVSLRGPGASTRAVEPLLKLRMHDVRAGTRLTFPSASGVETAVAFDSVRVTPNQPEQGILQLQVADALPQHLATGSALELRPLGDRMRVTSQDAAGQRRTWFADHGIVSQYSGVHVVERDAMPVADLGRTLTVGYHPQGLVHHRV